MICDECGARDATIKLMTIVNGQKRERHLCTACMAKVQRQFTAVDLTSLAGLLGGLLREAGKQADLTAPEAERDLMCINCGLTYEQFKKTGLLGCGQCYQAFREPLEVMLKRVHGHSQHAGRVPGGLKGGVALKLSIDRLKQQLVRAIAEEAYEDAALLRDQIRALKAQIEEMTAKEAESHE
ncbi:MAG: UvrB/UvrC motif-containing protein [Clostridia bacterium]